MFRLYSSKKKLFALSVSAAAGGIGYTVYSSEDFKAKKTYISSLFVKTALSDAKTNSDSSFTNPLRLWKAPHRSDVIKALKDSSVRVNDTIPNEFDLLIIGGGATGSGCAVDAATRGLKVAMIERDDFSSGTSSKSTKLVHGGVRYLQSAIMNLDYGQWKMVREALFERKNLLNTAPHLTNELAIVLPVYTWWQLPYFWIGCKMYDVLSGKHRITSSYFMLRDSTIKNFPTINDKDLVGSVVYYDGQQNDSRMNVSLALTAAANGAVVANHIEVISLVKSKDHSGNDIVKGAIVRDSETGDQWEVRAKGVINATGPFSDSIIQMDEPETKNIVVPSSGVHVMLSGKFCPKDFGLLNPETSDGRVVFFLPWEGKVLAGTTDNPCGLDQNPIPSQQDIDFIISEVNKLLSSDYNVTKDDVLSAWSGIRPLVRDPKSKNTKDLVRNHLIYVSDSKLVTISGGKWTTYREMAEQTIDEAVKAFNLSQLSQSKTAETMIMGGETYSQDLSNSLTSTFGLDEDIAYNLTRSYGDLSWAVAYSNTANIGNWKDRVHPDFPFIEAEIHYSVDQEYARSIPDVFGRRFRLAFLDSKAAFESIPKIASIMAKKLNWSNTQLETEISNALDYLKSMGYNAESDSKSLASLAKSYTFDNSSNIAPANSTGFNFIQLGYYRSQFQSLDKNNSGLVPISEIISYFKSENVDTYSNRIKQLTEGSNSKEYLNFDQFLSLFKN
ncbi:Glycerol-3-phosphate dehydrogenase, mitochondrial [Smittium culicis]|uniref:Glycerol-3-phosphate dehydrogenase n=1 Tax=Smittium culicis TaxID=133412 RepID=A0A1R1XRW1_9FUNG|nr:Glycerol-3-phosphate dehydrogenase, mitochondrial [Smittium culicis]